MDCDKLDFLNKLLIVAVAVLELSKVAMCNCHIDYILSPSIRNCFSTNIAYIDTNAFNYKFTELGFGRNKPTKYYIIKRDCYGFEDTSDYAIDNDVQPMSYFISLRPKLHLLKTK